MTRTPFFLLPPFLLFLSALLRFHRLGFQSFWNDEGNSARIAERSVRLILEGAAGDIHPPGYYLALAGWRALAGESEFALRALSAFAGIALVALVYRLGREYFDRRAALTACALAAVNPFLVYYSQEARMYMPAALLGAAAFWAMGRWLRATRTPGINLPSLISNYYLPLTLTLAFGLYTHYSFVFVLAALNLSAIGGILFHRRGNTLRRLAGWIAVQIAALALYLPWLPIAYRQLTTWPAAREFHPLLSALADTARYLAFGRTLETAQATWGLFAVSLLLIAGLRRGGQTVTPFLWLIAPVGSMLGLGLFSEAFAKFLIVAAPAFCLLVGNGVAAGRAAPGRAAGAEQSGRSRVSRLTQAFGILACLPPLLLLWPTAVSEWNVYYESKYFRADYRAIARRIESDARPGDAVLLNAPNQWEVFTYYHRAGAEVFPIPRSRPPDRAQVEAELERIAANHRRLFAVWWGEGQADPERIVESWLSANAFKASDEWYGDVRLSIYGAAPPAAAMATPLVAQFGDSISLDGFTLATPVLAPGDILQLTLFWHANLPMTNYYKVFVHLTGADSVPLAQHDGEPGGGLRPTTDWKPGEQVRDNHGLLIPADLPPGNYRLIVGLYRPADGGRLPVLRGGENTSDSLLLTEIRVENP